MRTPALVLSALLATGCYDQLKPGRCDQTSDCASGLVCSQEMTAGVYHRCIVADAGTDGMDAGDAADVVPPECTEDRQCSADKPVCGAGGACGPCSAGADQVCATLHASSPVCGPSGSCVECAASADCPTATKPVCDPISFTCKPCSTDADCAGRPGPGVCMAHQDGRCASEAETIYIQQTATCTSVSDPTGGTSGGPFCGLDKAAVALSTTRRLLVVRGTVQGTAWTLQGTAGDAQVSIVGQQTAVIAGGASPGVRIVASNVFIRDLILRRSEQVGISATSASTLRLQNVTVDLNGGGGVLLDASAFDIANTRVTGNGPGVLGAITWGGLLVQNPPPAGPARLEQVTVQNNNGTGVSCTGAIGGVGVLATGNKPVDVIPACSISSCGAPSATCGAM